MPKKNNAPGCGSLGVRRRKRANRPYARIRSWPTAKDPKVLGFTGYKVGMTHIIIEDEDKFSRTKGMEVPIPVSVVECPPVKVAAILLYKKSGYGMRCSGQINADKLDKEVFKCLPPVKKKSEKTPSTENLSDVRLLVHTQPKLTGIGKKKPELREIGLGGSVDDRLKAAQDLLGKEIKVSDVFKPGEFVDIFSVTKGKGYQGPVKRHGVSIRRHKSEKTKRGPGSLGPWTGNRPMTVPHAGQMGFMPRYDINKYIFKIDSDAAQINPKGGFLQYGLVKNDYLLIKGSVGGARSRLITMTVPKRRVKVKEVPKIAHVSLSSKQ